MGKEQPTGNAGAAATIEEVSPLSAQRAFVVQFRSGGGPGRFAGRVEHMPSAHAVHFGSKDELLAFLTRVLAEVSEEGSGGGTRKICPASPRY